MFELIAEKIGVPFNQDNHATMALLQKYAHKLDPGFENFDEAFERAQKRIDREGEEVINTIVKIVTTPPPEKVLKIKSSLKGTRIKTAAPSGIRYSFGPVWNSAVKSGTGIAIAKSNRHKLDYQAFLHGIEGAEGMDATAVCALLAPKILAQEESAN